MSSSIEIFVLGDYGPFSEQGKSIGYQLFVNGDSYLIDLGAPLFQQIGGSGIGQINGVLITHCHDDHKRWFTDVALFFKYAPSLRRRLKLFTSDTVAHSIKRSAGAALNQSLDGESKRQVDLAFEEYVEHVPVGPRARYRMGVEDSPDGGRRWFICDSDGVHLRPEQAKVVLSRRTGQPRMLFRDPDSQEWVEPETYYSFSSTVFYEAAPRMIEGEGYSIRIFNAPVWHGLPNFGLEIQAGNERLIFSSDTMHNVPLWQSLYQEKRQPTCDLTAPEFLQAQVLLGDINDYIERTWSPQRYEEAIRTFDGAAVIHDVTGRYGVVHTEYHGLAQTTLNPARTLLTHAPDHFTVVGWPLMKAGKRYRVVDNTFHEVGHEGVLWPIDADVYHKKNGAFFAGYKHPEGMCYVYEKAGYHSISHGPADEQSELQGELLFRANLFEDVSGYYLPHQDMTDQFYLTRPDGRAELIHRDATGSHGVLVENLRPRRHAIAPSDLAHLSLRRVAAHNDDSTLQAELRELQRTLVVMRERMEAQQAAQQDEIQRAVAGAQAEVVQLRDTAAALREALEKEVAARDAAVNAALKAANAEIVQLRETAAALREEIERREVAAANRQQEALSLAQQEAIQLRAAVAALRDQLDVLRA